MALTHSAVTLNSSTATALNTDALVNNSIEKRFVWDKATVFVQNVDLAATVYLGGAGVTSSSYGLTLLPGTSATIDSLGPTETLYAISSASSSNVAVLLVTTA